MTVATDGSEDRQSYIIVGAGCLGASTALHLIKSKPHAKVMLIDRTAFPCPSAASYDVNKVVRTDYRDPFYMKLSMEAFKAWYEDPILKPFYHESGILFADTIEENNKIVNNYNTIQGYSPAAPLSLDEVKSRFGGVFKDSSFQEDSTFLFNSVAGWVEATDALAAVIQSAIDLGVEYVESAITKILFDDENNDSSTGVSGSDGKFYNADNIILCTGPYTAQLLADSAPNRPEMQTDGRLVAAAIPTCLFKVPQSEMPKFDKSPIIANLLSKFPGDSFPPTKSGIFKCTRYNHRIINKVYHEASQQTISVPPKRDHLSTWTQDIPKIFKIETENVRRTIYGNIAEHVKPEHYRLCWDTMTPTGNLLICPHPFSKNLYLATGGSYHSWKFLPNIGHHVVKMLDNQLDTESSEKWAWDKPEEMDVRGTFSKFSPEKWVDIKDLENVEYIYSYED